MRNRPPSIAIDDERVFAGRGNNKCGRGLGDDVVRIAAERNHWQQPIRRLLMLPWLVLSVKLIVLQVLVTSALFLPKCPLSKLSAMVSELISVEVSWTLRTVNPAPVT